MPIVVEDGTLVTNSNSYVDVDDAKTYYDDLGYTYSSYLDSDIEAAILRTMRYVETRHFIGVRYTQDQSLSWPRSWVYDKSGYLLAVTTIPNALKKAVMEGAFIELGTSNSLQATDTGGGVKRKKIDVLETEWFEGASQVTSYTVVDDYLDWLVVSSSKAVRT